MTKEEVELEKREEFDSMNERRIATGEKPLDWKKLYGDKEAGTKA